MWAREHPLGSAGIDQSKADGRDGDQSLFLSLFLLFLTFCMVKWLTGTDEVVDQALNDQQSRK